MFTTGPGQARRRVFGAALALAVTAPAGFAQSPIAAPSSIPLESTSPIAAEAPAKLPEFLPEFLPGGDALERLVAPTLVPLPGAETYGWFADTPAAAPVLAGEPCQCLPQPPAPGLPAFGGPLCTRTKLTGDWGGFRNTLAEKGITWDIYSTNFLNDIANGGKEETFQYRGRMDYLLNVDGEKAGLWKGSFINLHAESVYGQSINQYSGAIMPLSIAQLVPVPNGYVTALTGVKFTQALSENFIVYGGKINLLDGFNQPFTGGARGVDGFWNASMVFSPVFARTLPYSAYGFGAAYLKGLEPILSITVLDTNNTPTTSGFNTFFDNGAVILPQINIPVNFFGLPGHQGMIGSWSSRRFLSTDREALLENLPGLQTSTSTATKFGSWAMAYTFDQALFVSPCDPKRMWGVFGNLGLADTNPSPIRWASNIGVGGSSPFQGRKLDSFGVGYFYTGLNSSFKNLAPRALPLRDEQGVEMFYNVGVTPWCHITPDMQVVVPASRNADTVLFVGLRAKIDF